MDTIRKQIKESLRTINLILEDTVLLQKVRESAGICSTALKNGNKIMLAGNGGSAADAQHLAAELVNRFGFDRPALAAIALTTDYGFEILFSRQLEAIGKKGDVLILLSTSGNSPDILNAIPEAGKKGIFTIGLTGSPGGKMSEKCDVILQIPSSDTPRIQEAHILLGHIICDLIENEIFKSK
jgi:D-sedoheptulose 7-phosphate isomerase